MSNWLSQLGLNSDNASAYASIFHQEAITEKALQLLTLQDLESLGVASYVHRILIHNSLQDGMSYIIMLQNLQSVNDFECCVDFRMIIARLKSLNMMVHLQMLSSRLHECTASLSICL